MAEFYTRFIRETMDEAYQVTPMVLPVRRGLQLRLRRHRPLGDLDPHRLAMLWRNHRGGKAPDLQRPENPQQPGGQPPAQPRPAERGRGDDRPAHPLELLDRGPGGPQAGPAPGPGVLPPHRGGLPLPDGEGEGPLRRHLPGGACGGEHLGRRRAGPGPPPVRPGPWEDGFLDLLAALPQQPDTLDRVPTLATDPLLLYFTSGTTGLPKGVLHDHAFPWPTTGGPVHAGRPQGLPPLRHRGHRVGGGLRHQVLRPVAPPGDSAGVRLRPLPPEQVLAFLAEAKATSIMAQPSVYRLLTQVGMDRYDLSSITNYAVGGEKLLPDLAQTVTQQTGHVLYEGYAQSEGPHRLGLPGDGAEGGLPWGKSCPSTTWRSSERTAPSPPRGAGEIILVADGGASPGPHDGLPGR